MSNLDTQQKSASGFLGLLVFAFFIIAQAGALFLHPELKLFDSRSFQFLDGLALALAIVFGIINIKNTFATNDNWKTFGAVATIIYTIIFSWIFISKGLK